MKLTIRFICFLGLVIACQSMAQDYFPLSVGNTWIFHSRDGSQERLIKIVSQEEGLEINRNGRKQNRKPNSDINYKLQLGTYALGVNLKYEVNKVTMYLLWYNKNTSQMREQLISPEWIEKALEYWSELNNILDDSGENFEEDLKPEYWEGVPFQNWECRYCQYYSICPSKLAE